MIWLYIYIGLLVASLFLKAAKKALSTKIVAPRIKLSPTGIYGNRVVLSEQEKQYIHDAFRKYGPDSDAAAQATTLVMEQRINNLKELTVHINSQAIQDIGFEQTELTRVVNGFLFLDKALQYENLKNQTIIKHNRRKYERDSRN